ALVARRRSSGETPSRTLARHAFNASRRGFAPSRLGYSPHAFKKSSGMSISSFLVSDTLSPLGGMGGIYSFERLSFVCPRFGLSTCPRFGLAEVVRDSYTCPCFGLSKLVRVLDTCPRFGLPAFHCE